MAYYTWYILSENGCTTFHLNDHISKQFDRKSKSSLGKIDILKFHLLLFKFWSERLKGFYKTDVRENWSGLKQVTWHTSDAKDCAVKCVDVCTMQNPRKGRRPRSPRPAPRRHGARGQGHEIVRYDHQKSKEPKDWYHYCLYNCGYFLWPDCKCLAC